MIGQPGSESSKTVFLIDFGLIKTYINPTTKQHIPFAKNRPTTGTVRYMSVNATMNCELSRRDDLEALGYMLLYLVKGEVPWSKLNTSQESNSKNKTAEYMRKVGQMKSSMSAEEIFGGFPCEFANYLR